MAKWQSRTREVCQRYQKNIRALAQGDFEAVSAGFATPKSSIDALLHREIVGIGGSAYFDMLTHETQAVEWALAVLRDIADNPKNSERVRAQAKNSLDVARVCYVSGRRSVAGAADVLHCSRESAYLYHATFIRLVAAKLGVLKLYKS